MGISEVKNAEGKNIKEKGGGVGSISFYFFLLSLVQTSIFILPGENANHQSQAACYVSV